MSNQVLNAFTAAEYDFTEVPETELKSCLYYEYMRESEAIIREVKHLRRQIEEVKGRGGLVPGLEVKLRFKKATKHRGWRFEGAVFCGLAQMERFPDVPWQKLSTADKQKVLDLPGHARGFERDPYLSAFPPLVIETPDKDPSLDEITFKAWVFKPVGNQRGPFRKVPLAEAEKFVASAPEGLFLSNLPSTKKFVSGFLFINLNYSLRLPRIDGQRIG